MEKSPFLEDNALFASKAKMNVVFLNFFERRVMADGRSLKETWSEENFFKKR